jgi:hypothetical protein
MKTTYTAAIVLALATLVAGQAIAADIQADGKTRAQVRAEVIAARSSLDARDTKDPVSGMTFRESSAGLDAAKAGVSDKTRAQVRAEAIAARSSLDARDTKDPITGVSYREMFGN